MKRTIMLSLTPFGLFKNLFSTKKYARGGKIKFNESTRSTIHTQYALLIGQGGMSEQEAKESICEDYGCVVSDLNFLNAEFAAGGKVGVDDRMYNFLKDDLKKLEKAVSESDNEEVEKFFSYWNYHLKSLENKGFSKDYDRMYNFLKDDLKKLEKAISEGDNEEAEKFFSYWNYHLKSLKMANGGGVDDLIDKWRFRKEYKIVSASEAKKLVDNGDVVMALNLLNGENYLIETSTDIDTMYAENHAFGI